MNLFLKERIEESVEILRMYEPPEGYYLAFSGGKDSVVLHAMAQLAGVKFDAHYNITTADPPEVINFIRNRYPLVQMDKSEMSMWQLIPQKLMPPTRLARYCCKYFKESGGENRIVLTGVKKTDSHKRRSALVRSCRKKGKVVINPLLNWSDDEIWAFIHENNLPYCNLYDQGFSRLGCIGCPMAGPRNQRKEFERWPKYKQAYLRAFDRMLNERLCQHHATTWHTAEDVMAWWLKEDGGGRHVTEMTSEKVSDGD